jgi:hypothetical protein
MKTKAVYFILIITFMSTGVVLARKIKCSDGNTVNVPNNPGKEWRLYAKRTETNIKASIDIASKVKIGNIDMGTKGILEQLTEKLNQYSTQVQLVLKAAYMGFAATPCDANVRNSYFAIVKEVSEENKAIAELTAKLNDIKNSGNVAGSGSGRIKAAVDSFNHKDNKVFKK